MADAQGALPKQVEDPQTLSVAEALVYAKYIHQKVYTIVSIFSQLNILFRIRKIKCSLNDQVADDRSGYADKEGGSAVTNPSPQQNP
jgi:hypothetical protein